MRSGDDRDEMTKDEVSTYHVHLRDDMRAGDDRDEMTRDDVSTRNVVCSCYNVTRATLKLLHGVLFLLGTTRYVTAKNFVVCTVLKISTSYPN